MRTFLIVSLFGLSLPAKAINFFNDANSKIMYGASQYHQYRSGRIDASIENSRSTTLVTAATQNQKPLASDIQTDLQLNTLFFHRLFESNGGLGLNLSFNQSDTKSSVEDNFFWRKQFNFINGEHVKQSRKTSLIMAPLMSYTLAGYVTFGFELKTSFISRGSKEEQRLQQTHQTGVPSITFHTRSFELGAVYQPNSSTSDQKLEDLIAAFSNADSAPHQTAYFRFALLEKLSLGGFVKNEDRHFRSDHSQTELSRSEQEYGAHIEYFRDTATKFEFTGSQKDYGQTADLYSSISVTGAIVHRKEGHSGFSASVTGKRIRRKIESSSGEIASMTGEQIAVSISTHWKM